MKPTFLGIGAQKSATTWLYDILSDHPDVCLSANKELDFFSYYFDFGYQWYERNFNEQQNAIATGEVSPSYLHSTEAPKRVHDYEPAMKLIVILRDPVQRAISNHKHEVRINHLRGDDLSFEYGLKNNPMYIGQGMYATHLHHWQKFFPKHQILVELFDDVVADGAGVARRVYEFLEVNPAHQPAALTERSNESYVDRSPGLETSKNWLRTLIRAMHLGGLWKALGDSGIRNLYRSFNRRPSQSAIPKLLPETRDYLDQIFADEITRLESLLGRNLDVWRRVCSSEQDD
jgi:hypothetical protein